MKYKAGDEVLVKAKIAEFDLNRMMYLCELQEEDCLIRFYCPKDFIADKTYVDGLNDAWKMADKLNNMPLDEVEEVLGIQTCREGIFSMITFEQALAKIEAYEKEKEIKVGDVVHHIGGKTFIVTYIHDDGHVSGITEEGGIYSRVGIGNVVKAGKHIDIESLLRQIGE